MSLFLIALVLIGLIGYLAQTTGLCMVRGVNEATSGKPLFLLAIVFSGTFAWTSALIARLYALDAPFISYGFTFAAVIGGFLFGIGAAINNGCGVSTVSKLAKGQLVMIATILGWLIGWVIEAYFFQSLESPRFQIPPQVHYGLLISLSLAIIVFVYRLSPSNKKAWISMLGIGVIAGIVFLVEPKWTPSGLLRDISLSLLNSDQADWPSLQRFILIAGLLTGMIVGAFITRGFQLTIPEFRALGNHLFAGILMGIGAAVAGGGNDSQLLLALPSLSPAGIITVASIVLGIFTTKQTVNYYLLAKNSSR